MPHDLDLGSGHMAYCRASLIKFYLHTKFHSNRRTILWMDGRTHVWTDKQTSRQVLLGRLRGANLKCRQVKQNWKYPVAVFSQFYSKNSTNWPNYSTLSFILTDPATLNVYQYICTNVTSDMKTSCVTLLTDYNHKQQLSSYCCHRPKIYICKKN